MDPTDPRGRFIAVSVEKQAISVCANDSIVERYECTTCRFAVDSREKALGTPAGRYGIRLDRQMY
jgi:hypothetical protein